MDTCGGRVMVKIFEGNDKKEEELVSLSNLRGERDMAVSKASKLQDELKKTQLDLKKTLAALDHDHKLAASTISQEVVDCRNKIDSLERELEETREDLHRKNTELNTCRDELEKRKSELEDNLSDVESLAGEVRRMRLEIIELSSSLEKTTARVQALEVENKEVLDEKVRLISENGIITKERDKLSRDLERAQTFVAETEIIQDDLALRLEN
jgi:chromosome segregation ATPase